jgi:hypothetical protein
MHSSESGKGVMSTLDRAVLYLGVLLVLIIAVWNILETKKLESQIAGDVKVLTSDVNAVSALAVRAATNVNITMTYDNATCDDQNRCTCSQSAPEMAGNYVKVPAGGYVTWVPGTSTWAVDVQFLTTSSPFYRAMSPQGSVASGQFPQNDVPQGTQYPYNSVTINGKTCRNAGSLGLIMK